MGDVMGGRCEVEFANATPHGWQLRIIEIGAKFFYQDSNGNIIREWYTMKNVNLSDGDKASLFSDDVNACVQQVFAAVKVVVPGENPTILTGTNPGDPQHCKLKCSFTIAPKNDVSTKEYSSLEEVLNFQSFGLFSLNDPENTNKVGNG